MLAEENENLRALLDMKAHEADVFRHLSETHLEELERLKCRLIDLERAFDDFNMASSGVDDHLSLSDGFP